MPRSGAGPEVHPVQLGRIRAGHLQGPRHPALQPAFGDRGHGDRLLRHRLARRLQLHARRIPPRALRALRGGAEGGLRERLARQGHPRQRRRHRHPFRARRRRLHLRRRDRDDGIARGQEGPAALQAAVPGQLRPVRQADHDQQHRDLRFGAGDHPQRRRVVPRTWASRTTAARRSSRCPATSTSPGNYEIRLGTLVRATCWSWPAACATAASSRA